MRCIKAFFPVGELGDQPKIPNPLVELGDDRDYLRRFIHHKLREVYLYRLYVILFRYEVKTARRIVPINFDPLSNYTNTLARGKGFVN